MTRANERAVVYRRDGWLFVAPVRRVGGVPHESAPVAAIEERNDAAPLLAAAIDAALDDAALAGTGGLARGDATPPVAARAGVRDYADFCRGATRAVVARRGTTIDVQPFAPDVTGIAIPAGAPVSLGAVGLPLAPGDGARVLTLLRALPPLAAPAPASPPAIEATLG